MATPIYKPTEPTPTPPTPPLVNPNAPGAPQPKTEPDTGHPNAADKPFHERMGGGAADPNSGALTRDPGTRRKDDKDD